MTNDEVAAQFDVVYATGVPSNYAGASTLTEAIHTRATKKEPPRQIGRHAKEKLPREKTWSPARIARIVKMQASGWGTAGIAEYFKMGRGDVLKVLYAQRSAATTRVGCGALVSPGNSAAARSQAPVVAVRSVVVVGEKGRSCPMSIRGMAAGEPRRSRPGTDPPLLVLCERSL